MPLESMSAVFSNTQHKNGSGSVHSSVATPDAYKIFYLNRGTLTTWKAQESH